MVGNRIKIEFYPERKFKRSIMTFLQPIIYHPIKIQSKSFLINQKIIIRPIS